MTTQTLRETKRAERAAVPKERREAMARSVAVRVTELGGYIRAGVVLAYAATAHEIDPAPIVEHALANGKRVCFPIVRGGAMLAAEPLSQSAWKRGAFGILEPDMAQARIVELCEIGCAIVPGIVFDEGCNRIGQGGGYYDRFFAGHTAIYRVGIAFECQVVERVAAAPHDIAMNAVATDERLICRLPLAVI